jgi:hypothetical protein
MSVYADQKIFSRQTFNFPRLNKGSWHKYQLFPTKAPFGREMLYICRLNYFSRDWPYILRPKFFSRQWLYFLATKFFWSAFLVANCVISCSDYNVVVSFWCVDLCNVAQWFVFIEIHKPCNRLEQPTTTLDHVAWIMHFLMSSIPPMLDGWQMSLLDRK